MLNYNIQTGSGASFKFRSSYMPLANFRKILRILGAEFDSRKHLRSLLGSTPERCPKSSKMFHKISKFQKFPKYIFTYFKMFLQPRNKNFPTQTKNKGILNVLEKVLNLQRKLNRKRKRYKFLLICFLKSSGTSYGCAHLFQCQRFVINLFTSRFSRI